jgi:hypothetical protein
VDYASYRRWRDETIARRPEIRRLDCMNPEKALAPWVPVAAPARTGDLAAAWARATGQVIAPGELVLSKGVREVLAAAFAVFSGRELWLPQDVYPVYWELARAAGHSPAGFPTLSGGAWSFLEQANPRALAVLPVPLSPLGRWPSSGEVAALVQWLRAGPERGLLVDAVYTYDFEVAGELLAPLLATGRCGAVWSCSKSWLSRDVLGIGRVPREWASPLQDRLPPVEPGRALALLETGPELPRRQAQAFRREWQRLAPAIRQAAPDWCAPATGYFATVALPYDRLLDRDLLAVPGSVFGGSDDRSIVSCLHDLVRHEREAGP